MFSVKTCRLDPNTQREDLLTNFLSRAPGHVVETCTSSVRACLRVYVKSRDALAGVERENMLAKIHMYHARYSCELLMFCIRTCR